MVALDIASPDAGFRCKRIPELKQVIRPAKRALFHHWFTCAICRETRRGFLIRFRLIARLSISASRHTFTPSFTFAILRFTEPTPTARKCAFAICLSYFLMPTLFHAPFLKLFDPLHKNFRVFAL
jgi:hypothetical protein